MKTDKFYLELTKQLRAYQDETAWLNAGTIQEMVEAAEELAGLKALTVSAFPDGSTLTIAYAGNRAEAAFYQHIRPGIDRIHRDILERTGVCCDDLKNALGSHERYPVLVRILTSDWEKPYPSIWRFPGAAGPGFYCIYNVDDPENTEDEVRVTYVPLTHCIFCHTSLEDAI